MKHYQIIEIKVALIQKTDLKTKQNKKKQPRRHTITQLIEKNNHLNNWQLKELFAAALMSAMCFRRLGVTMLRDILRAFILLYHEEIKGSFSKCCHYSSFSKQFKHWRQNSEFRGAKTEEETGSIINEITVVCLGVAAPSVQHAHMTVVDDNNQIMLPLTIRQTQWGRKVEPVIKPRSSKRSTETSWNQQENIPSNHQLSGHGCATHCLDSQTCHQFFLFLY